MKIRLDIDLPVNIEPADPTAARQQLKRSRAALVAAGVAAGLVAKAILDRALPDEEFSEGEGARHE